ncbi:MAG: hypothetical protein ACFFBD_09250 [Candidatus Hodarchaeota archaeon]
MNIKLNKLNIENFKGLKSFELNPEGENIVIKAENGVGKTTVYDAFLWLLFGKDSTGRKDFELRPLDNQNQPIKGLVLSVEAEIFNGSSTVLRKEHHEKVVKNQLRGYETLCWIDEVPKKVSEYNDYIASLISEDTFKLLTDLYFFNSKMHWLKRREVLLDITGKIGTPEGFDVLIESLNGRNIDEYKKVLIEQKKRHVKERDEINPRIDEIQRGLDEYAGSSTAEIENQRQIKKIELQQLDSQRTDLLNQEEERQIKIDHINNLKASKIQREAELKNDTSGIKSLLDEKNRIEAEFAKCNHIVIKAQRDWEAKQGELSRKKILLDSLMRTLAEIRDEYSEIENSPAETTCYACGQQLPANNLESNKQKRQAKMEEITKRGNHTKNNVDVCKKEIATFEDELESITKSLEKAGIELQSAEQEKIKRFAEIDIAIKENKTPAPEQDKQWRDMCADIKQLESEIGKPISEQLQAIESERSAKSNELAEFDKALAQADRMKKDKSRIAELESEEKELAQKIADVDRQLKDIEQFNAAQSELIESSVNSKFKYVEFKLFNQLLNGGLEDCCEATYQGIPYADMSTGQQIIVGIDIINVLSAHYDISVPLFIDHAESLTLPLEAKSQTIELYAQPNIKKLSIEKKGELVNV